MKEDAMIVHAIDGSKEFDSYDLEDIPECDIFVYWYETAPYEGSGFSIWRKENLYGYHNLDHCSCYGPLERISPYTGYSLEEMETIVKNYLDEKASEVLAYIKEH
jgi:hypothetical protein